MKLNLYSQVGIIHLVRTKNFPKKLTFKCAYQGVRNVSFSENFTYVVNK